MSIDKPYYRIARPKSRMPQYTINSRYASDRLQLSRAYIDIEKDLREIFNFIEPDERNLNVFSFKLYSLLLRACTEVELNCKLIMIANDARPQGRYFTMDDYKKIEKSSLLSKYKVFFKNWRNQECENPLDISYREKEFIPFQEFGSPEPQKPQWYSDYNEVKHNREINLHKANLFNCMNAVAGILVLLYSQFGANCIETYGTNGPYIQNLSDYDDIFDADIVFRIEPPGTSDWRPEDLYTFNWHDIKELDDPFQKFDFNIL